MCMRYKCVKAVSPVNFNILDLPKNLRKEHEFFMNKEKAQFIKLKRYVDSVNSYYLPISSPHSIPYPVV